MKIKDLGYHPQHPQKVWVVIGQPKYEPYRMRFDPETETFQRTEKKSLGRGNNQFAYGWVGGAGTPPRPHLDVFILTPKNPQAGEVLEGVISGIFFREDGDNKLIAVDSVLVPTLKNVDLLSLEPGIYANVISLYPRVGEKDGWFGAEIARATLLKYADGGKNEKLSS